MRRKQKTIKGKRCLRCHETIDGEHFRVQGSETLGFTTITKVDPEGKNKSLKLMDALFCDYDCMSWYLKKHLEEPVYRGLMYEDLSSDPLLDDE